jgi:PhnB protein
MAKKTKKKAIRKAPARKATKTAKKPARKGASKGASRNAKKSGVKAIPDGYHTLTPATIIPEAAEAILFYEKAFGAKTRLRMDGPDGSVAHAELVIGDSAFMIGTAMGRPAVHLAAMLYVTNCDAVFDRALDAGATVKEPLTDKFYGDRSGTVSDPFGNEWTIATHKEDVSEAEMMKRMAAAHPPKD